MLSGGNLVQDAFLARPPEVHMVAPPPTDLPSLSRMPLIRSCVSGKVFDVEDEAEVQTRVETKGRRASGVKRRIGGKYCLSPPTKNHAQREINDLDCARMDAVEQFHDYT
jgi:hypothetical protein